MGGVTGVVQSNAAEEGRRVFEITPRVERSSLYSVYVCRIRQRVKNESLQFTFLAVGEVFQSTSLRERKVFRRNTLGQGEDFPIISLRDGDVFKNTSSRQGEAFRSTSLGKGEVFQTTWGKRDHSK